jgi:hypothetical protein
MIHNCDYSAAMPSVEGAKDLIRAETNDLRAGIFDVITIPLFLSLVQIGDSIA